MLPLLAKYPKARLLGWGFLASVDMILGPISLQVQISYYSSRKPLPLAYAVLYLTCVGKSGAMLKVWPRGLGQEQVGGWLGMALSNGLFTKIN